MDIKKMVSEGVVEGFASLLNRNHSNANGEGNNPPAQTPPAAVPTSTQLAQQQPGATATTANTDEHPVLKAAFAAGVKTADDFAALKANSDAYAKGIGDDLKAEAVRKFGTDKGLVKFANYSKMALEDQKAVTAEWREESDEKYGIGKNGEEAGRQTAPAQLPTGTNAEGANTTGGNHSGAGNGAGSGSSDTAWSKLSEAEQAFGNTMGFTTPEAREKFAAEQLRLKGAATN